MRWFVEVVLIASAVHAGNASHGLVSMVHYRLSGSRLTLALAAAEP